VLSIAGESEARPQIAAARTALAANLVSRGCIAAGINELDAAENLYRTMRLSNQIERTQALRAKLTDNTNVD
jgi:hypothetical protein